MSQIFTVSEFNQVVKGILQELGIFKVTGEVTELTITAKQGVYITLSDGKSNLKVSGYAPRIKGIDLIEKGMTVQVEGGCDIYVPYGTFSLSIHSVEPLGEGALAIAYGKLKQKLESEGLFDEIHKKVLPKYITRIALLTGKDSAAYSDFVKILKENDSSIEVDYYPVIVQGEKSVRSILDAITKCNKKKYDLIVLSRGGGSLEDLKSFNDEELARVIFLSSHIMMVGVGHEKDESIADFVADIRASTPSQCAYYIVSQNRQFIDEIFNETEKISSSILQSISSTIDLIRNKVDQIDKHIDTQVLRIRDLVSSNERLISAYDLEGVLKRGYAIIQKNRKRINSVNNLDLNEKINIRMSDGKLEANVNKIDKIY